MSKSPADRIRLASATVKGFKSINSEGQTIPFGDVTILLGANGAGKSNLVSFFKMLNHVSTKRFQNYVGKYGADQLLHVGTKKAESISFQLNFENNNAKSEYEVKLSRRIPDRLFVSEERVLIQKEENAKPQEYRLPSGGAEIALPDDKQEEAGKVILSALSQFRTYQFHDTSDTAKIKDRVYVNDAQFLRSDAGNLAAFLRMLKLKKEYSRYYERIVRYIRNVMPQFGDFALDTLPEAKDYLRLDWSDSKSDHLFSSGQISDGSLRFMALATLLLQPPALLPRFIVLDEPELGLHPAAITDLAAMIKSASQHAQVLVATQSTLLVDNFSPEQIVIVEHDETARCSRFKKLNKEELQGYLERYSLSELWEKNVLGGRP